MKKTFKKISAAAMMMLMVGAIATMTACEKEDASPKENAASVKGLPSAGRIAKYAAILGVKPEAIVDVEYRSGMYHSRDTYYPNGNLKSHEWWCEAPQNAACCTVVHVKAGVKSTRGGEIAIDEGRVEDNLGLIAVRTDDEGRPQSVILMFDGETLDSYEWIQGKNLVLREKFPIINLNLMEGFDRDQTAFVRDGEYKLENLEDFCYVEIPISELDFIEGMSVEK